MTADLQELRTDRAAFADHCFGDPGQNSDQVPACPAIDFIIPIRRTWDWGSVPVFPVFRIANIVSQERVCFFRY